MPSFGESGVPVEGELTSELGKGYEFGDRGDILSSDKKTIEKKQVLITYQLILWILQTLKNINCN